MVVILSEAENLINPKENPDTEVPGFLNQFAAA
jgi:hypothetical protein